MLNTNYAKLAEEYPEYLRLPVELQSPLIINGVTHLTGVGTSGIRAARLFLNTKK